MLKILCKDYKYKKINRKNNLFDRIIKYLYLFYDRSYRLKKNYF